MQKCAKDLRTVMENLDNAERESRSPAARFRVITFSVGSLFRVRTCIPRAHVYTRTTYTIYTYAPPRVSRFAYASTGYAGASEPRNL